MEVQIPDYFLNDNKTFTMDIGDLNLSSFFVINDECKWDYEITSNLIIIVLLGEKILSFDNRKIPVKPGEIIFIKKGNYTMNEKINPDKGLFNSLAFRISDNFIRDFIESNKNIFSSLGDFINYEKIYKFEVNEFIKANLESIFPYLKYPNNYSKDILKLKIYELIYNIIQADNSADFLSLLRQTLYDDSINLRIFMEANYHRHYGLKEFAGLSGRSMTKFKNDFKRIFNDTPKKWLNKKRLEKSRFIILNSDKSITDICQMSGFDSLSYFINLFKKEYCITPKQMQSRKIEFMLK